MAESNTEGDGEIHYPFTRCSSTGSLHAMTSSANTTDDEDSDLGNHLVIKDRRREAHTQAEQKRRDSIKKGYECLQELVPRCQNSDSSQSYKQSKATVLQKSVDYIHYMQNCKKKQEEEVAALNKEVVAMTIMKLNYDQIVSAHQSQPGNLSRQVSDDVKFEVFRAVIDSLFQTFDLSVSMNNFAEVSGSVIQWVEEHCKPQILREVMCGVLDQLQHEYAPASPATNQNMCINSRTPVHGSVPVLPISTVLSSPSTQVINTAQGTVLQVSSGNNIGPVLYSSPGSSIAPVTTMPSHFLDQ